MSDTHQEDEVLAGPLIFTVPAYGFVMAELLRLFRCDHPHCPVSAGETGLGSLCSPSRRVNDCE
jgi:hypothetical protein